MSEKVEEFVLTTEIINDIEQRENLGKILKRYEKVWFSNTRGVRKANLIFAMSEDEFEEYIKCKIDIHYFAEKYCQIKREDGTVGPMILRDYQKDIIDLYTKNPRSILMASRQTGKCMTYATEIVVISENDKKIKIPIGLLYFNELKKERKLTLLEKIKNQLYYFIYKLQ